MKIIEQTNKGSIPNAASVLKDGGILVFPTDTVYGIGCILDEKAIQKLYQIKNRPVDKPTAVLIGQNDIPETLKSSFQKFPAGHVTIIAGFKNYPITFPQILIKDSKIGVRIPDDEWLQKLINIAGPIVASSANIAGDPAPKSFSDLSQKILSQADLVIKSDRVSSAPPSTVYDIELKKIIRN